MKMIHTNRVLKCFLPFIGIIIGIVLTGCRSPQFSGDGRLSLRPSPYPFYWMAFFLGDSDSYTVEFPPFAVTNRYSATFSFSNLPRNHAQEYCFYIVTSERIQGAPMTSNIVITISLRIPDMGITLWERASTLSNWIQWSGDDRHEIYYSPFPRNEDYIPFEFISKRDMNYQLNLDILNTNTPPIPFYGTPIFRSGGGK